MYPHERSLVKRLAGKPFVLLGVNSDPSPEIVKKAKEEENLTWRSWLDGGIDGPIHQQWNIVERPSVFLIDEQGIIRYRNVFGTELDRAVDSLVEELMQKQSAQAGGE